MEKLSTHSRPTDCAVSGAVKDGWDGILESQLDIRHRPCNFVELLPRLRER